MQRHLRIGAAEGHRALTFRSKQTLQTHARPPAVELKPQLVRLCQTTDNGETTRRTGDAFAKPRYCAAGQCRSCPLASITHAYFSILSAAMFSDVTPCSRLKATPHFGETYRIHVSTEIFTAVTMKKGVRRVALVRTGVSKSLRISSQRASVAS
jgi:hypothetical protein